MRLVSQEKSHLDPLKALQKQTPGILGGVDMIHVRGQSACHLDHGNQTVFAPPTQFYRMNILGFDGGQLYEVFYYLPSLPLSSHHPVPPRILLTRLLLGVEVLCGPLWGISKAFCLCTALLILSSQPNPAEIFLLLAQIISSRPGLSPE